MVVVVIVVVLVAVGVGDVIVVVVVVIVGVVVVVVVVVVAIMTGAGTYQHLSAPAPIHLPLCCRFGVRVWVVVMVVIVVSGGAMSDSWEVVGVFCAWMSRMQLAIAAGSPTRAAIFLHPRLSCASAVMSARDRCCGRSMKNPPSDPRLNCTWTASFTSLSPRSLSKWPSHLNRRCLIALTRS
jgi:hypothetical protein